MNRRPDAVNAAYAGFRAVGSGAVETTTCFHHPDRPTGRACTRCGRPACPDCLRDAAVGSQCFECVRDARPPAVQRARQRVAGAGPVVTKAIVAINVGVFLLTAASPGGSLTSGGASQLQRRLALDGPDIHNGELYRLVTSGFIHYGVVHILFNVETINYAFVADRWARPGSGFFWRLWDLAMVVLAVIHGLNGLRQVLDEYVVRPGRRVVVHTLIWTVATVLVAVGSYAILMFEKDQDYIRDNPRIAQPPMAASAVVAGAR